MVNEINTLFEEMDEIEGDAKSKKYEFSPQCNKPLWNFSFPVIAAVIYIAQLMCDLSLATRYLKDGDVAYFWATLFFALLPFVVINPVILLITVERTPCFLLKFYLVFEQLGCYVRCFYCAVKAKAFKNTDREKNRQYCKQMLNLRKSTIIIDFSEAVLKMFTQYPLQIYIVYQKDNLEKMDATGFLQKLSISFSCIHLIWNIVCIFIEFRILYASLGVILIIADIGSDLLLFGEYLREEQYLFASLNLTFVVAASIYITYRSPRR